MKIDRTNYEAILIDFLDGNLSPQDVDSLMDFLSVNPDLEEELALMQDMQLEPATVAFEGKSLLKRSETLEGKGTYFDELCIAQLENEITSDEKAYLDKEIASNPKLKKEFDLYQDLKLTPDQSILFNEKGNLKKTVNIFSSKRLMYISSAAAAVAIFALSWFMLPHSVNEINNTMADVGDSTYHKVIKVEKPKSMIETTINAKTKTVKPPVKVAELKRPVQKIKTVTVPEAKTDNKEIEPTVHRENVEPIQFTKKLALAVDVERQELYADINQIEPVYQEVSKENIEDYQSIPSYLKNQVKDGFAALNLKKPKVSGFNILQTGVKTFGVLSESNMKIEKEYDDKGELIAYVYTSDSRELRRKVKK